MNESIDQDYYGPEGAYFIKNSMVIYEDNKTLEVKCDFSGNIPLEKAVEMIKADVDGKQVIINGVSSIEKKKE